MADLAAVRNQIVTIASQETIRQVNWKANEARILEYFLASTGKPFTKQEAQKISWCSYFVHWVLLQCNAGAGIAVGIPQSLPMVQNGKGKEHRVTSVGRFFNDQGGPFQSHPAQGDYVPKPGDMFYLPKIKNKYEQWVPVHHIGLVTKVEADGKSIWTANGNSGDRNGHGPYDLTYTTYTDRVDKAGNPVIVNGKQAKDPINLVGYGYVYSPPGPKKIDDLPDNMFLELSV